MPRGSSRQSPASRGAVRVASDSSYRPQLDDDEGTEMDQVGARWTRTHADDKTLLPEVCWRILVYVGLFLAFAVSTVAAVFAILAWTESDEIAATMAKLGQVEDTLASGLGLPGAGAN